MKKLSYLFFFILSATLILPPKASAVGWIFYAKEVRGIVTDARTGLPINGVTVSYDIYRGVGKMYRNNFALFEHVEAKTNLRGAYILPSVAKPYWLMQPKSLPSNCFMPGIGLHAGFSITDVTVIKRGYQNLIKSKERLEKKPDLIIWPVK